MSTALILRPLDTPNGPRTIRQWEIDGFICLTDLCQAEGKLYADWRRLAWVEEYLHELSLAMGIPIAKLLGEIRGVHVADKGTWGHLRIALRVANGVHPGWRSKSIPGWKSG